MTDSTLADPISAQNETPQEETYKLPDRDIEGNARMLVAMYQGRMYFNPSIGWLVWERGRWRKKTEHQMYKYAKRAAKRRASYKGLSDEQKAEERKWLKFSVSWQGIRGTLAAADGQPEFQCEISQWDSNPLLFGLANGVLDFERMTFREEQPEDFILKHSSVSYDEKATCPRFEEFLQQVFADEKEMIPYVQRAVGYSLTGLTSERKFFACHGSGANGKSTLLSVLETLFGEYHQNLPFAALEVSNRNSDFDLADLPGKRFVTASESGTGFFNEPLLKRLTGQDTVTAAHKHRDAFQFRPVGKLWLALNTWPSLKEAGQAFFDRVQPLPFNRRFVGKDADPHLAEKLQAELPGILNFAIEGYKMWKKDGLKPPQAVTNATAEYQEQTDDIGEFVAACLETVPTTSQGAPFRQVWAAYRTWCGQEHIAPVGRNTLYAKLAERGFERKRLGHPPQLCWAGVRVRQEYIIPPGVAVSFGEGKSARLS